MNVGELKAILSRFPDGLPVVAPMGLENREASVTGALVAERANRAEDESDTVWGDDMVKKGEFRESCFGELCEGEPRAVVVLS